MKASLISPVYRTDYLVEILQTYLWQDADKKDYEVIFIATNPNNSQGVQNIIRMYNRKYDTNWHCFVKKASNCEARNFGVNVSKGQILIFADGDQLLSKNMVSAHIERHQERFVSMGIVNIDLFKTQNGVDFQIRIPPCKNNGVIQFLPLVQPLMAWAEELDISHAIGYSWWHSQDFNDYVNLVTRNCSIGRKEFEETGGFDEQMGFSNESPSRGWEDLEWSLTCHEKQIWTKFVPCWAIHLEHDRIDKDGGRANLKYLLKKHPWFLQRKDWFEKRNVNVKEYTE